MFPLLSDISRSLGTILTGLPSLWFLVLCFDWVKTSECFDHDDGNGICSVPAGPTISPWKKNRQEKIAADNMNKQRKKNSPPPCFDVPCRAKITTTSLFGALVVLVLAGWIAGPIVSHLFSITTGIRPLPGRRS